MELMAEALNESKKFVIPMVRTVFNVLGGRATTKKVFCVMWLGELLKPFASHQIQSKVKAITITQTLLFFIMDV